MARIPYLADDKWDARLSAVSAADQTTGVEKGPLRIMAHSPEIAVGFVELMTASKAGRVLPERLLELMRLRIAFHNQCRSCMAIRYRDAIDAGLDEGLVCSLEKPEQADDLTPAEALAVEYGSRMATDHLSIGDTFYDSLREHFSEREIVELGFFAALFVGFGRLSATWDMTDDLPDAFSAKESTEPLAPSAGTPIIVR